MTVSTTSGTEFSIDVLLTASLKLVGVIEAGQVADEADLSLGRILLDMQLDELLTEGVYAKSVDFVEILMIPGTFKYVLASNILDLIGDGAYIDPTNADLTKADGETPVQQMDRAEWQRLSSKSAEGRPYKYYLFRKTNEVRVWPVPDEAGTIRFQAQLFFADTTEGDKTLDLRVYWNQYLLWEMAHQLGVAKGIGIQRASYFNKRATQKKDKARAFANEHVDNYVYIDHPHPWRGK